MNDRFEIAKMAVAMLPQRERTDIFRLFDRPEAEPVATIESRIIRRPEAARLLARSPRAIDRLAKEGALKRVLLPGRVRGAGFRLADVRALIEGRA